MSYWFRDDSVMILPGIAYGPSGFVCGCGCSRFESRRALITTWGVDFWRPASGCSNCGKEYIFVTRLTERP